MALREDPRLGPRLFAAWHGRKAQSRQLKSAASEAPAPVLFRLRPASHWPRLTGARPSPAFRAANGQAALGAYLPRSAPPCSKRCSAPNRWARHQRRDRQQDVPILATQNRLRTSLRRVARSHGGDTVPSKLPVRRCRRDHARVTVAGMETTKGVRPVRSGTKAKAAQNAVAE